MVNSVVSSPHIVPLTLTLTPALRDAFLGVFEGEAAGWCSAGPRVGYRYLDDEPVGDADAVGSVMCFVVTPAQRGKCIARSLLHAALVGFAERGLTVAEA